MGIVQTLGTFFRSAETSKPIDKYSILSPLLATEDYLTTVKQFLTVALINSTTVSALLKNQSNGSPVGQGAAAYRDYVRGLPSRDQALERSKPFSTVSTVLDAIASNLTDIEDNFELLFGALHKGSVEANMKASSLVVLGYLERSMGYLTWLTILGEHLTATSLDAITPFHTKEMLSKAPEMAEFAVANLHVWTQQSSLLNDVRKMQQKGSDLSMRTDSTWIDGYGHDSQFSPAEQELMTASLRSPIMWALSLQHVASQWWMDVLTSRKEWLTAKIVLEQAKLRNMDPQSQEYKRLQSACDHYAALLSKYERKIEKARA